MSERERFRSALGEACTGLEQAERELVEHAEKAFGRGYKDDGEALEMAASNARSWLHRARVVLDDVEAEVGVPKPGSDEYQEWSMGGHHG